MLTEICSQIRSEAYTRCAHSISSARPMHETTNKTHMRCKNEANEKSFQNSESIHHTVQHSGSCCSLFNEKKKKIVQTSEKKSVMYTHPQKVNKTYFIDKKMEQKNSVLARRLLRTYA